MELIIRAYDERDKQGCIDAFKSNVPLYFTEEEISQFDFFLDHFLKRSMTEKKYIQTFYYVIERDKKIIGCGGFGDKEGTSNITLAWGLVHKDFHKQGFGEKLLAHRLNEIHKLHPGAPVLIDTTQFSYPFFEKFGFVTTSIIKDFYAAGMDRYDMIYEAKANRL